MCRYIDDIIDIFHFLIFPFLIAYKIEYIFDEMTIKVKTLTCLNHEFKEYESINIECEIGVLDFWHKYIKRKQSLWLLFSNLETFNSYC